MKNNHPVGFICIINMWFLKQQYLVWGKYSSINVFLTLNNFKTFNIEYIEINVEFLNGEKWWIIENMSTFGHYVKYDMLKTILSIYYQVYFSFIISVQIFT
jgi:hypothetical protein